MAVKTLLIHFLKLGVGIASTEMEYADSTSFDTPPTTGWQTTPPQWQDGHYIWTRTHITYTNGKETYTSPVCTTGSQGEPGNDGQDAITINLSLTAINHKKSTVFGSYVIYAHMFKGNTEVSFSYKASCQDDNVQCTPVKIGGLVSFKVGIKAGAVVNSMITLTFIYQGVTYTRSIPITTVSDGDKGDQGERGAVLRGPQLWSDCGVGYCFEAGETGKEWKDTVIYNDNTYSCVKSHVKTADNYPGSADDINNGYWRVGSPIELIVANIIMSRYQLVKNLGVETIEMKDADGNIVFRAKDGEVLANKGTFNNIVCDHGEFTNAVVTGDLNLSTLRYLANGGGNMGAAVMAKAFNLGYGPFILPHLNDNECMRVVFYNPVITRSSLPAKVSCQGSNDVLKPASDIYTPTSYRQIEVSGWCEMIGSNLTSGKTTWIYNYIVQS